MISEAVNPNVETLIVKESTVTTDIRSGSRWMRAVEDVIVILVSFHFFFFFQNFYESEGRKTITIRHPSEDPEKG